MAESFFEAFKREFRRSAIGYFSLLRPSVWRYTHRVRQSSGWGAACVAFFLDGPSLAVDGLLDRSGRPLYQTCDAERQASAEEG